MKKHDSRKSTQAHRRIVAKLIFRFIWLLLKRTLVHDKSKLSVLEKPGFDEHTPMPAGITYGSDEYKQRLASLGETLKTHYSRNRHHPEFYPQGVKDMDLVDVVEMFCDWLAATKRHNDGNIFRSIENNEGRFGTGGILASVFRNTAARVFGEKA